MSEKNESGGETASNYLDKIKPKDLIMFSAKTRKITRKVNIFNLITVSDAVKAAERFDYVVTPEYANRLY